MTHPSLRRARTSTTLLPAAALAVALVLSACAAGDGGGAAPDDGPAPGATPAEPGSVLDLAAVCPATVVMQQDWQPQAEHGGMYELVGDDYAVDTDAKAVTGSLVAQGVDTGVEIEVRSGGPNVGFQRVSDLMHLDTDILIGAVNTDQAISAAAAGRPVVALTSQMTLSPQIYMWDPATYPDATTIADVAATGATIVTSGEVVPTLLAEQGIVSRDQVDASYEGTPQRFVTDPSIIQQGFGTNEPYVYENDLPQWDEPVAYQYLHELGYSIYPEPITVREADVTAQADCLERLVPILQRSQLDFLAEPERTNALIVDLVEQFQTSWTYSPEVGEYSVATQLREGIVTDDPASGVFGQIDGERIAATVETFTGLLTQTGALDEGVVVDPESLYTNQFIDTSISMADVVRD
ncbi:hypothetical protein [Litorihabitans aurantiacus]|uniref:Nitrate ABC transporter substrate-binding protein n=1 Tax=Litorihabitans aurantiacus TaxID=1930061 RepID=A0AA37XG72_9MICO|nr:hypothetical protein [Litorihabitans aurantiacus]GMA32684.1 nitrate ABC transporter substrate-binding protein [Litorihabitans aurantiacus]